MITIRQLVVLPNQSKPGTEKAELKVRVTMLNVATKARRHYIYAQPAP